jgi:hypothetical protein
VGLREAAAFATQQRAALEAKRPFFLRVPVRLDNAKPSELDDDLAHPHIYLWVRESEYAREQISHMVIAPLHDTTPLTQRLRSVGYEYSTHPRALPGQALWFIRGVGQPIRRVDVTNSDLRAEEEEVREEDGMAVVQGDLAGPLLCKALTIWVSRRSDRARLKADLMEERVVRDGFTARQDERDLLEALIASFSRGIERMLHVPMTGAQRRLRKLRRDILDAQGAIARIEGQRTKPEEDAARRHAVSFFAMSERDVRRLAELFRAVDADGRGSVDIKEFLTYIHVPVTGFSVLLLESLDARLAGGAHFGIFLRAVTTFAIASARELIAFLLQIVGHNLALAAHRTDPSEADANVRRTLWDADGRFRWDLIRRSRPLSKVRFVHVELLFKASHDPSSPEASQVRKAVNELHYARGEGDYVSAGDVRRIMASFPEVAHPAFALQRRVREAFLGFEYWAAQERLFTEQRDAVEGRPPELTP